MGAALDTPTKCSLCDEMTRDPVTLKCNHQFCQRCIGDLWSVNPSGPYHCPQWRCKTVYQTLPFSKTSIQSPALSHSTAGTSSNTDQSTLDSYLKRPSLTSRLLGKRKASTPVSEHHAAKRTAMESPSEQSSDTESPTTSLSEEPGTSKKASVPESVQFEQGDGTSKVENSDSKVHASSGLQEVSVTQNQPKLIELDDSDSSSEELIELDDSVGSSEVDLCDAPLSATPQKDMRVTETHTSPKKPASPANSDCKPGVSNPGKISSPAQQANRTPLIFPRSQAAALGSSNHVGILPRPENKHTNPVPCHYCPKTQCQPAVKTCLVCGASMCKEHLRPHLESAVFQNHTLVPPMEDISLYRCQEHQEINRIYCRQCAMCVCTVCTVIGSHRNHACISIREAEIELRANLNEDIKQLQNTEQQVKSRVSELTEKKETFRVVLNEAQEGVKQQYRTIREALEQEEQSALQCVMKEENRVLGSLEKNLCVLKNSLQSLQNSLHTLESLADARVDRRVQDLAFIVEYSRISQMIGDMEKCVDQCEGPEELDHARLGCLEKWTEKRLDTVVITIPGKDRDLYRLLYGTFPVLDADTAHPKLQLSDNNRRVVYSDFQQAYTEHEARFSSFPQVLASSALEGGRWYWEVMVSMGDCRWKVGLCESQIERKGQKDSSRLGFNSYSWCLAYDKKKVEALHNKESVPVKAAGLQKVGVLLDFEEGILSFFNVAPEGSLTLLHSYKQGFSVPLYPAFSLSKTHLTICDLFRS